MAERSGIRILEEATRALESKLRRSINIPTVDDGEADDASTLGDESSLGAADGGPKNPDDPYDFLTQQCLNDSSSDESSYWSSSEDDDSDDEEEEDSDSDSDDSLQHDTTDDEGANSDGGIDIKRKEEKRKIKRNDSSLSIDAIIKMKMQMGVLDAKSSKDRGTTRRGRRISQERITLGSLAKKIGSSTGNEISADVKEGISSMRRSESTNKLKLKATPKRFMHIQQAGNPQKMDVAKSIPMDQSSVSQVPANVVGTSTAATAATGTMRRATIVKYGDLAVNLVKPRDHYLNILRKENIILPLVKHERLEDFFLPITAEDKAAFDMTLVGAVRDQNLPKIKELHAQGHPLQARSQFGESLLHVCARRGTPEMLRFMLQQEGVSARTCCDYGRTPLHDAAWSTDAKSLEMMKILIQECPDLLLVLDKRGSMPLDYIPKERWPHCNAFLDKYKDMILPTGVLFGEDSSSEEEYSSDEF